MLWVTTCITVVTSVVSQAEVWPARIFSFISSLCNIIWLPMFLHILKRIWPHSSPSIHSSHFVESIFWLKVNSLWTDFAKTFFCCRHEFYSLFFEKSNERIKDDQSNSLLPKKYHQNCWLSKALSRRQKTTFYWFCGFGLVNILFPIRKRKFAEILITHSTGNYSSFVVRFK